MIGSLARMMVEEPYYAALTHAPWASGALRAGMGRVAWHAMPAWRANLRRNAGLALGPDAGPAERERCARAMMAAMQLAASEVLQSARATPEELRAQIGRAHV